MSRPARMPSAAPAALSGFDPSGSPDPAVTSTATASATPVRSAEVGVDPTPTRDEVWSAARPQSLTSAGARRTTGGQVTTATTSGTGGALIPAPTWRFGMAPTRTSPHLTMPLQTSRAWHVARRVAHGPTAALAADIDRVGPRAWIDKQLAPSTVPDDVCDKVMSTYFPWENLTTAQVVATTSNRPWMGSPHLVRSVHARQLFSRRVLLESMVDFWSDLLYIAAPSSKADSFVLEYNRKVLRTHALGRFSDMLQAAVTHPAMLLWLDNASSTQYAMNENLGRELLELHTVGVGNYTEADVKDSARILTGHSVDWSRWDYTYSSWAHSTGPVKVMGFTHANATAADGPAVLAAYLRYLALHPATAKRIARRLAVRFVSDAPSDALVSSLAQVYLANGSDIRPVLRALFVHSEFDSSTGQKVRRPQEYLAAMMRASDPDPVLKLADPTWLSNPWSNMGCSMWLLDMGGQIPRYWPYVDGFPDQAAPWLGTNKTRAMWNCAESTAGHWDSEIGLRGSWGLAAGQNAYSAARALTQRITGFVWPSAQITKVASWLTWGEGQTTPPSNAVLTADQVTWCQEPVRLVMASPYMFIR